MEDKIGNSILVHQMSINQLQEIKERVKKTHRDEVILKIQTKHWYGYADEADIKMNKDKFKISKYTMNLILEEAIKKERERIDKLIDLEILKRETKE